MGAPTARTKRLVVECVRRAGCERQAADEPAAASRRADRAAMKARSSESDARTRSYHWRATLVLTLIALGALGLAARAVELQLVDHGFLAKQGDDLSLRIV